MHPHFYKILMECSVLKNTFATNFTKIEILVKETPIIFHPIVPAEIKNGVNVK